MVDKVKLAIYDKDLKARTYQRYELSEDGQKIKIGKGEGGIPNPTIDNDSYIELPSRSLIPPFRRTWDRIYFVPNGSKACVNFRTQEAVGPDRKSVMDAARAEIISNWGKNKQETPILTYLQLLLLFLILLKLFGVIV